MGGIGGNKFKIYIIKVKYFGVIFEKNFSWDIYVWNIIKKVNFIIVFLRENISWWLKIIKV